MLLMRTYRAGFEVDLGRFVLEPSERRPWIGAACALARVNDGSQSHALLERVDRIESHTGLSATAPGAAFGFHHAQPTIRVLETGLLAHRHEMLSTTECSGLVKHGLLVRHEMPFINREVVYSVSTRLCLRTWRARGSTMWNLWVISRSSSDQSDLHHSLELNEIHLALKRSGALVYWMPETEIRSRNDLTTLGIGSITTRL